MPKYKPFNKQIVDPIGVNTSIAARPMEMGFRRKSKQNCKRNKWRAYCRLYWQN